MIECWMCPKSPQGQCKHEKKYCKRYTKKISESHLPNTRKEYEEIRQKEKEYWGKN
ncbi:hypothetical protein [uncultured Clostridium sp.]|uniref:hypothetical protein n=1 Tax=uncultured Clostridium sp. TaxID=59620 RepID=UPI0028F15A32|nr:hypothetical protein [uncultured Clostridium sp.]